MSRQLLFITPRRHNEERTLATRFVLCNWTCRNFPFFLLFYLMSDYTFALCFERRRCDVVQPRKIGSSTLSVTILKKRKKKKEKRTIGRERDNYLFPRQLSESRGRCSRCRRISRLASSRVELRFYDVRYRRVRAIISALDDGWRINFFFFSLRPEGNRRRVANEAHW